MGAIVSLTGAVRVFFSINSAAFFRSQCTAFVLSECKVRAARGVDFFRRCTERHARIRSDDLPQTLFFSLGEFALHGARTHTLACTYRARTCLLGLSVMRAPLQSSNIHRIRMVRRSV